MTEDQVARDREARLEWTKQFRKCNHLRQLDHNGNRLPCLVRTCPEEYRGIPELKVIKYPENIQFQFYPDVPAPVSLDVVLYRRQHGFGGYDFWSYK